MEHVSKLIKCPCCRNIQIKFLGVFSYAHLRLSTQIFRRIMQSTLLVATRCMLCLALFSQWTVATILFQH